MIYEYDTVIYIDTSVKIRSNEIDTIIQTVKQLGMMSRYIKTSLNCYTDNRMYEWFNENENDYESILSAEANFIILHRNFLTSLLMKVWVTCALDETCLAPKGSHIYGGVKNWLGGGCNVCGCHRFDQDALSIVFSFFFGYPVSEKYDPVFAFTIEESFFYNIVRRDVKSYIVDQFKAFFILHDI